MEDITHQALWTWVEAVAESHLTLFSSIDNLSWKFAVKLFYILYNCRYWWNII